MSGICIQTLLTSYMGVGLVVLYRFGVVRCSFIVFKSKLPPTDVLVLWFVVRCMQRYADVQRGENCICSNRACPHHSACFLQILGVLSS